MKKFILFVPAVLSLMLAAPAAVNEDLVPIDPDMAHRFAKKMCEEAAKFDKPQVKVEANPDKASGLHSPGKVGLLIAPQKDLAEGEELAGKLKNEKGTPVAYLFLYHLVPVLDGKTVDPTKLRSVKLTDDNGTEHTVFVLLLAARQVAEEEYRLYAYGHDEKPIVDSKFSEGTGPGSEPVAIEVKDMDEQAHQGKIVVTVFGKYQASFKAGYIAD